MVYQLIFSQLLEINAIISAYIKLIKQRSMGQQQHKQANLIRNIANTLTFLRMLAGLPILIAITRNQFEIAWLLLLIAGISDILDGYLARLAGGGTPWGAKFDPLADKILLSAPFIWLAVANVVPIWSIWLLISREIIVSAWRSNRSKGGPASSFGKAKTILQFISLLLILWPSNWSYMNKYILQEIGIVIFWISIAFALLSANDYLTSE